jgi:tripartite-type tricarboxylate transporter receptor subunit TctC
MMQSPTSRRRLGTAAAACGLLLLAGTRARPANTDDFPSRPLRLIVGFAPGGTTDFDARLIADKVKDILGQSVVVENRQGANGAIAAEYIARAEPDGYNLFFTNVGAVAINPSLRSDLAYDPIMDFTPVAMLVRNTILLVTNSALPANDARDFAALAKQRPGGMTVGVTGVGAATYLSLELFRSAAGVPLQAVPYRGAAQALSALVARQIDGMFGEFPVLLAQMRAGNIKALGAMSRDRSEMAPQVQTFIEQGFADVVSENWSGVLAPARTPPTIVAKLNAAFTAAVRDPEIRQKLVQSGVTPSATSAAEFGNVIRSETERWSRIIREKGIKADASYR